MTDPFEDLGQYHWSPGLIGSPHDPLVETETSRALKARRKVRARSKFMPAVSCKDAFRWHRVGPHALIIMLVLKTVGSHGRGVPDHHRRPVARRDRDLAADQGQGARRAREGRFRPGRQAAWSTAADMAGRKRSSLSDASLPARPCEAMRPHTTLLWLLMARQLRVVAQGPPERLDLDAFAVDQG